MPSFGSTSSHLERKHDGPTRQIPLNKALVAFKQVISSGLLDRTNVRICHHSRPICVSDVMSRYASVYASEWGLPYIFFNSGEMAVSKYSLVFSFRRSSYSLRLNGFGGSMRWNSICVGLSI